MKFYIEAGANDGIFQSRSLHLANNPEYFGLLIEPLPAVYLACCNNRPNNTKIYNCALVDFNYTDSHIPINVHSLYTAMATINKSPTQNYLQQINVPARTLDSILQENEITDVDYLYLDVEGYEYNVLNGINFNSCNFKYIEIECHYSLMNISKDYEINLHTTFLNQFGYKLSDHNDKDGNYKIIFTH